MGLRSTGEATQVVATLSTLSVLLVVAIVGPQPRPRSAATVEACSVRCAG